MAIYQYVPEEKPNETPGEFDTKLFTHNPREGNWEPPPGYVNPRLAIREAVQMLEAYEPSRAADIATGMIIMISQTRPQHLKMLLEALEASPISADTADAIVESMQFMNSHDRQR